MNDVDRKVHKMLERINVELGKLGSTATVSTGTMTTEDTGEPYSTVEFKIGAGEYLAYSSPNAVGIKTFLQGVLVAVQLISGGYRLKPLSEIARRMMPQSIIPRLSGESAIAATESRHKRTRMNSRTHPRFSFQRNKFK